jgi:hypothetical protein
MAGLKKPDRCPCGSADLKRERDPERWVCKACGTIVVSRKKKFPSGTCRGCGALKKDVPFKPGKNLCVTCGNKVHKEWSDANRDKIRAAQRTPEARTKRGIAVKKSIQRSAQAFLKYLLMTTKRTARNGKRRNPATKNITITFDYVWKLYESQDGKCAVSHLPLVHEMGQLCTMSIDRINSDDGYVPGNVHLVCQWINHAKRQHALSEIEEVLDECLAIRANEK